jgi:hypothetical protein
MTLRDKWENIAAPQKNLFTGYNKDKEKNHLAA